MKKKDIHIQEYIPKAHTFYTVFNLTRMPWFMFLSISTPLLIHFYISLYMKLLDNPSPFSSPSILPVLETDILHEITVTVFFHVVQSWKVICMAFSVVILLWRMFQERCVDVGEKLTHPSKQGWSLMQHGKNYRWKIIAIKF